MVQREDRNTKCYGFPAAAPANTKLCRLRGVICHAAGRRLHFYKADKGGYL